MSSIASNADAGENSGVNDDVEHNGVLAGEFKKNILRYTTEERFATWTESLGSESSVEKLVCGDKTEEEEGWYQSPTTEGMDGGIGVGSRSSRGRKIRRKSRVLDMDDFPPLLSILNENERSRFDLIKNRDNGRLQITMVRSERPEVVAIRSPPMQHDKRLKFLLINTQDDQNQGQEQFLHDQDDDHEDQDQDEEERSKSNISDAAPPDQE